MAAKVCIHMEGKKTTISNPGVSIILCNFAIQNVGVYCCCKLFGDETSLFFRAKIKIFHMIFPTGLLTVQTNILHRKNR